MVQKKSLISNMSATTKPGPITSNPAPISTSNLSKASLSKSVSKGLSKVAF